MHFQLQCSYHTLCLLLKVLCRSPRRSGLFRYFKRCTEDLTMYLKIPCCVLSTLHIPSYLLIINIWTHQFFLQQLNTCACPWKSKHDAKILKQYEPVTYFLSHPFTISNYKKLQWRIAFKITYLILVLSTFRSGF